MSTYFAGNPRFDKRKLAALRGPQNPFMRSAGQPWNWLTGGGFKGAGGAPGGTGYGGGPDAYYAQLQSMLNAQSLADRAGTKAAIQQALIGWGEVPAGFKDEFGALDKATLDLIKKNTSTGISGFARMLQQKEEMQQQLINRLSASGLRRSGAKGAKLRKGQLDYDRARQDALAALLSGIGDRYSAYAQNEGNRQFQLLSALYSQSGNNYVAPGGRYTPPRSKAPPPPGGNDKRFGDGSGWTPPPPPDRYYKGRAY